MSKLTIFFTYKLSSSLSSLARSLRLVLCIYYIFRFSANWIKSIPRSQFMVIRLIIFLKTKTLPQLYRYSFGARYAVVDIVNENHTEIVPPNLPANREPNLQNFQWGPSGTSLAFVFDNNIYYQSSLDSAPQQITTSGQIDVIYNGVPDWVYEGMTYSRNHK